MKAKTSDVAKLFASTSLEKAKSHGAMSFDGLCGKSYGVTVAKIVGAKRALVTSKRYSVTTSRHTNEFKRQLEAAGFVVETAEF